MQRHQRFVWTWAAAGVFAVLGLLGACDPAGTNPSLVGMGPATDGFELNLEEVPLTAEPKQYTIDVSRVAYGKVVGDFSPPPPRG